MIRNIAILDGDGIGPEVMKEAIKVLNIVSKYNDISFDFNYSKIGASAIKEYGNPFPEITKNLCDNSDAILFGAIGDPSFDNDPNAKIRPEDGLLEMRQFLGLYANVRPIKTYNALLDYSPIKKNIIEGTDFIVFRELTGGIYFGKKGKSKSGNSAYDTCSYSKDEILRVSHLAFKEASKRKNKLTLVDKANVLSTSKLWRETIKSLEKNYSSVEVSYLFVDNAAMKIITNPSDFDVILTENMFGDILTDESSVITGSLGMLPSASIGNKMSLYEPIHGSYPEASGKNIANPMAMILSAAMMLKLSFNLNKESDIIESSVNDALQAGIMTKDINSSYYYKTSEVGDWISKKVEDYFKN
tara:strand:- start:1617 stop:2690 length:1074 start_codon:yes stop_codon:yes gene_type:complete